MMTITYVTVNISYLQTCRHTTRTQQAWIQALLQHWCHDSPSDQINWSHSCFQLRRWVRPKGQAADYSLKWELIKYVSQEAALTSQKFNRTLICGSFSYMISIKWGKTRLFLFFAQQLKSRFLGECMFVLYLLKMLSVSGISAACWKYTGQAGNKSKMMWRHVLMQTLWKERISFDTHPATDGSDTCYKMLTCSVCCVLIWLLLYSTVDKL